MIEFASVAPVSFGRVPMGVAFAEGPSIEDLQRRGQEILARVDELDAQEELTDEEQDEYNGLGVEAAAIERRIEAKKKFAGLRTGTGRVTAPEGVTIPAATAIVPSPSGGRTVPASPRADSRTGGFKYLGEFAMCVRAAALREEGAQGRLLNAVGMNEGIGEDGGFLVPAEFRDGIMRLVEGEDSLLSLCDNSTTARNSVTQNVDKTTPWGTAGIQVYWEGEGQAAAASKAPTDLNTLRLNKLFARVDVTDELLEDAPQLDNHLRVKAPEAMTSVINLAIVQGNGVGKPLGFLKSPALVTVSKKTSQPADTIFHTNLIEMMGRMYARSWPRARWLMHQDVWAKLPLMSFADVGKVPSSASGTQVPIYIPPGALSASPFGTLLGRPIMVLEAMETIGDIGDIALVDMTQYRAVTKAGGARVDTSIHLKFDTDETVYRFIFRLAGAPWWSSTISPRDGSNTRSPFVTLESR